MSLLDPSQQGRAFRWIAFGLALAAAFVFVPMWAPLVLAVWVSVIVRPLFRRVARAIGGRHRAAGLLVLLLVLIMLVPLAAATVSLVSGATQLVKALLESDGAKSALVSIVSGHESPQGEKPLDLLDPQRLPGLIKEYGSQAFKAVTSVLAAAGAAALGLFVFVNAIYVFLVDGPALYDWLETHSPIDVGHTRRLVAAFHETGRGLFIGVGLTGAAQGVVATITYFALGVPRALILGLLTCVASLFPSIGTALVWVPVAAGLALTGRLGAAAIMAAVGVLAIGTIDNLVRPIFARFGKLALSNFVLTVSMFGGLAAFGAWGLVLGPLFTRLAKEAILIVREDHLHAERGNASASPAGASPKSSTQAG